MDEEKHFTAGAICKAADVTPTTLNTWRARRLVEFPKNNSLEWTRYSVADAMVICLVAHMVRSGLGTKLAAQVATGLREENFLERNFAVVFDVIVDPATLLPGQAPYSAVHGPRASVMKYVTKHAKHPVFHCIDLKEIRDKLYDALKGEV
jgi:hypothetical protein